MNHKNKIYLKITSTVVTGVFLFNTIFTDTGWAFQDSSLRAIRGVETGLATHLFYDFIPKDAISDGAIFGGTFLEHEARSSTAQEPPSRPVTVNTEEIFRLDGITVVENIENVNAGDYEGGLHARMALNIIEAVDNSECHISITNTTSKAIMEGSKWEGEAGDLSPLELLLLGVGQGHNVDIELKGQNASLVGQGIVDILTRGARSSPTSEPDEMKEPQEPSPPAQHGFENMPIRRLKYLLGILKNHPEFESKGFTIEELTDFLRHNVPLPSELFPNTAKSALRSIISRVIRIARLKGLRIKRTGWPRRFFLADNAIAEFDYIAKGEEVEIAIKDIYDELDHLYWTKVPARIRKTLEEIFINLYKFKKKHLLDPEIYAEFCWKLAAWIWIKKWDSYIQLIKYEFRDSGNMQALKNCSDFEKDYLQAEISDSFLTFAQDILEGRWEMPLYEELCDIKAMFGVSSKKLGRLLDPDNPYSIEVVEKWLKNDSVIPRKVMLRARQLYNDKFKDWLEPKKPTRPSTGSSRFSPTSEPKEGRVLYRISEAEWRVGNRRFRTSVLCADEERTEVQIFTDDNKLAGGYCYKDGKLTAFFVMPGYAKILWADMLKRVLRGDRDEVFSTLIAQSDLLEADFVRFRGTIDEFGRALGLAEMPEIHENPSLEMEPPSQNLAKDALNRYNEYSRCTDEELIGA